MAEQDWRRCIQVQRAWMNTGTLYLWVDRGPSDWRSIPNPAQRFDTLIRAAVRELWGRDARAIRYLDRPPNRERIINERRIREHDEIRRRSLGDNRKILAYAKEECRQLYREVGDRLIGGTGPDKLRKLQDIAIARAKLRLRNEELELGAVRRQSPPPNDPPQVPDPQNSEARGQSPEPEPEPERAADEATPVSAEPETAQPGAAQASPSAAPDTAESQFVGSAELHAALENMPWLTGQ